MIKDAHKKHEVKLPCNGIHVIDGTLFEFDLHSEDAGGETRLIQVAVVDINPKHSAGSPPLRLY